ncbi:MAG: ComEC/Rec2 family competence protein [Mangrovibacterium sp.]
MKFFQNNPLVRILLFWMFGLLTAKFAWPVLLLPALVFPFALFWYLKLRRSRKYPFDVAASVLIATTLILLSAVNFDLHHPKIPSSQPPGTKFLGRLDESTAEKANSYQSVLTIIQAENDSLIGQQVAVLFEKTENAATLETGQVIFGQTKLQRIENNGNPFEFDYQTYMAQQGIYFRCFLASKNYRVVNFRKDNLAVWSEQIREKLLEMLGAKLKKKESKEIIPALTLGYRKDLQSETRDWFVRTGAMHVLAVSGLHVGLIYLILSRLFFFFDRYRWGKWVKIIVVGGLLWAYALITGLSPSVQRATLMFSFVLVAQSLRRNSSVYNTIAGSALFLMLFDPDIIFAVGFQLSYAAVLSIVYFYPKLEALLPVKNRLLKWFWQLFCVSFAAQIGTFPLSIYYFSQFPVYFWLSNFIVIPAAFVILAGTFAFFLLYPLPAISRLIANALDYTTSTMLQALEWIGSLPQSVVSGISISFAQLIILLLLILLLVLFIEYRKPRYFLGFAQLVLLYLVLGFTNKLGLLNQHQLLEYRGKQNFYQFVSGRESVIVCPDSSQVNPLVYSAAIQQLHLRPPKIIEWHPGCVHNQGPILIHNQLIQFGKNSYIVRTDSKQKFSLTKNGDKSGH